jgi:hypothetical protein
MKVFNFENLTKGDCVGFASVPNWGGATYYDEPNRQFLHIAIGKLEISYREEAGRDDYRITPEEFGCEAICYCTGKNGIDQNKWDWDFQCTPEFFEKNKEKILSFVVERCNNY